MALRLSSQLRKRRKKTIGASCWPWLIAGGLALLLIAFVFWWHASKVLPQTTFYSAPLPFAARDVAVSPNGHTVAIVGRRESDQNDMIWIYEPGALDANSLTSTEGASFPFWSR